MMFIRTMNDTLSDERNALQECRPVIRVLLFPPPGGAKDQSYDDGIRDHHGGLPASGQ